MKAAVLKSIGNIEELKINLTIEDFPIPEITNNEILINVKYASINHRDVWITKGLYSRIKLPVILGSDCSGIIHSKGSDVTEFNIGDEVIINPGLNWGTDENFQSKEFKILGMPDNGTFAEYLKIDKAYLYKKPGHLSFEEASAIPLTGITAYCSVFKKAGINKDDNVLITGIGGGVASAALVFAKSAGAKVFVTSGSDEKISKAISIGAEGGVNYTKKNWDKDIIALAENKIDVVIDGTGGDTFLKCIDIINYGGRIISYGSTAGNVMNFPLARIFWKQLKIFGSTMGSPANFVRMIKYINDNKLEFVVDSVLSLENIADAFERMASGKQFGKIVIKI
ncbi:MAG: zinc-binding dehydrogenase [Ignavibacteria bacterium]|nr:zinc-binding dehydrogenase [Ignavibacteria bacterium]